LRKIYYNKYSEIKRRVREMTYEFAKYPDGILAVFSNIGKKENGEEYINITFERPTENGFDTFVIEIPSYEIVLENGNYSSE